MSRAFLRSSRYLLWSPPVCRLFSAQVSRTGCLRNSSYHQLQFSIFKRMASFGTLYGYHENSRSRGILAVAKANGLDLEVIRSVPRDGFSEEYLKLNKLGRIPTFVGSDGYVLTEAVAIAVYVASQNDQTTLLGSSKQEYASIVQWMSFFNMEVQGPMGRWWRMLNNIDVYDEQLVATARTSAYKALDIVEDHLSTNTYLVGGTITLADFFCVGFLSRGFERTLDKTWRSKHPHIKHWYDVISKQPPYIEAVGDSIYVDETI